MRLFGKCLFFKVCVFTSLFDTEYFVVLLPFFFEGGWCDRVSCICLGMETSCVFF